MQIGGPHSSNPSPTASSVVSQPSASQSATSSVSIHLNSDIALEASLKQGNQDKKKRAEAAERQGEIKFELGSANLGASKAKSIGHADTDTSENARPIAHETGKKEIAASGMHGFKNPSFSGKDKAVSGFSLGSGGAHFASKKDKAKKEQKELTPEQLEKKALGLLKKHYTTVTKKAAALGAQKMRDAEAARTTPPPAGPFAARPTSAFGSRTQMKPGIHPKTETPTPFRHMNFSLGGHVPIDRVDSRSLPEDNRQRASMQPRPTPLKSHTDPRAAQFEEVSAWNDKNRMAARSLAESHGDRVPAGGWPKITGQKAARDKQAIREIDKVLLSHDLQLTFREDKKWGLLAHYRAPEPGQKTGEGVEHTGRGAVYDKNGLLHLLSHDRPEDVFIAQTTKYKEMLAKKAQRKTEGENQ